MLKGIEVDQCELERELIRRHTSFVDSLKRGPMNHGNATSRSNIGTVPVSFRAGVKTFDSTRSSSAVKSKPPMAPPSASQRG